MQLTPKILHDTDTNEPIAPMTLASQVFREDGTTMLDALWFDAEDEEIVEDIDIATKDYVDDMLEEKMVTLSMTIPANGSTSVIFTSNPDKEIITRLIGNTENVVFFVSKSAGATYISAHNFTNSQRAESVDVYYRSV